MKKKYYRCSKCNTLLNSKISNPEYFKYCPECDEDMFKFECVPVNLKLNS